MLRIELNHPEYSYHVTYTVAMTKRVITLVNPSANHIRRLAMLGHDLELAVYKDGILIKSETYKY